MIFAANGDRIELSYEDGVVNGKATIKGMHHSVCRGAGLNTNTFYINDCFLTNSKFLGSNGDKETCVFVNGTKHGPATYHWKAGHR